MFVYLLIHLIVYLFIYLFTHFVFIYFLFLYLLILLFIYLFVYLFIYLIYLFIYQFIYYSFYNLESRIQMCSSSRPTFFIFVPVTTDCLKESVGEKIDVSKELPPRSRTYELRGQGKKKLSTTKTISKNDDPPLKCTTLFTLSSSHF